MIDTLTTIPNIDSLHVEIEKADQPKLFLIDIKDFSQINMTHSDEGGNFILLSFSSALKGFAQTNDMLYFRVKDDEFALLKNTPFELNKMEKIVFDLSDFVSSQQYDYKGTILDIDANIGICFDHTNSLKKAQSALDLAQKEDQLFVTYSEFANRMLEESEEEIGKAVKESIEDGSTNPYFQRVIDLDGNTIYNETLIRIMSKDSIQTPKFFLTIAYKRGFYSSIMKILIEKIITIKGPKAINLDYKDLLDDDLFEFLILKLKNSESILELHKNEEMDYSLLSEKLKEIKANNIAICIDNVKDISDFSIIDNANIDFVKVHGNLIRMLAIEDEKCENIILTCKKRGIKTIATHINSNKTLEEAKKRGFDYYQGFFFGKPSLEFN